MTTWRDRYLRSRFMVQKIIREYSEKPTLKAYVEIFLTMTAISLFGVFAIRPTIKTIGQLIKEIDAKEKTLATMTTKIEDLRFAKELAESEKVKIELVREAIPQKPEPDILALQIEQLSKSDNVNLRGFTIEDVDIIGKSLAEADSDITLSINVIGNYFSLTKFATDLENLRRPMKFDGLILSRASQNEASSLTLSLLNLSTPFLEKKQ